MFDRVFFLRGQNVVIAASILAGHCPSPLILTLRRRKEEEKNAQENTTFIHSFKPPPTSLFLAKEKQLVVWIMSPWEEAVAFEEKFEKKSCCVHDQSIGCHVRMHQTVKFPSSSLTVYYEWENLDRVFLIRWKGK